MRMCTKEGCNFTFKNVIDYRKHARVEHNLELLPCTLCRETSLFATPDQLVTHHRKSHSHGVLECPFCPTGFETLTGLQHHICLRDNAKHKVDVGYVKFPVMKESLHQATVQEKIIEYGPVGVERQPSIKRYGDHVVAFECDNTECRTLWTCEVLTEENQEDNLDPNTIKKVKWKNYVNERYKQKYRAVHKWGTKAPNAASILSRKQYSCGHLVPANNHRNNKNTFLRTFWMYNIVAMDRILNLSTWKSLEEHIHRLLRYWKRVIVFTIVVYADNSKKSSVGGTFVHIPSEFFKIVILEQSREHRQLQVFRIKNSLEDCYKSPFSLRSSLEEVYAATGLLFQARNYNLQFTWDAQKKFQCDYEECVQIFTSAHECRQHRASHPITHNCFADKCRRIFMTERQRKEHIRSTHTLYGCKWCEFKSYSNNKLMRHVITHSQIIDTPCLSCHSKKRLLKCRMCASKVKNENVLRWHLRRKHGLKNVLKMCPRLSRESEAVTKINRTFMSRTSLDDSCNFLDNVNDHKSSNLIAVQSVSNEEITRSVILNSDQEMESFVDDAKAAKKKELPKKLRQKKRHDYKPGLTIQETLVNKKPQEVNNGTKRNNMKRNIPTQISPNVTKAPRLTGLSYTSNKTTNHASSGSFQGIVEALDGMSSVSMPTSSFALNGLPTQNQKSSSTCIDSQENHTTMTKPYTLKDCRVKLVDIKLWRNNGVSGNEVIEQNDNQSTVALSGKQRNISDHLLQKKVLLCNVCRLEFQTHESLARHMNIHLDNDGEKTYKCEECKSFFYKMSTLRKHVNVRHTKEHKSRRKGEWPCFICENIFTSPRSQENHIQMFHSNNQCPHCLKDKACFSDLEHHIMICDLRKPASLRCSLCKCYTNFTSETEYNFHLMRYHASCLCPYCDQKYDSCVLVDSHLLRCDEYKKAMPFLCPLCNYRFKFCSSLKNHANKYHVTRASNSNDSSLNQNKQVAPVEKSSRLKKSTEEFECKICNANFVKKQNLILHIEGHLNTDASKKFQCVLCELFFKTEQAQIKHSKFCGIKQNPQRRGPMSHVCEICQRKFYDPMTLKAHLQWHKKGVYTNAFQCHKCERFFHSKRAMELHMKIHVHKEGDKKKFHCTDCESYFFSLHNLKCHRRVHKNQPTEHPIRSHRPRGRKCILCSKFCYTEARYAKHLKTHEDLKDSSKNKVEGESHQEDTDKLEGT